MPISVSPIEQNVRKLMGAAWIGMMTLMEQERKDGITYSGPDIISAAINLARHAVRHACQSGDNPEETAANRVVIRAALQKIMLDTIDSNDSEGSIQ